MRSRLPWFLFAVSLALNLLFAAGVLHAWLDHGGREFWQHSAADDGAEALELTDAQQAGLEALRSRLSVEREEMRDAGQELRQIMLAELVKPEFDRPAVERLLAQRAGQRQGLFADMIEELHDYLQGFTPQQRATFLELAQDRGFMRRFLFGERLVGATTQDSGS